LVIVIGFGSVLVTFLDQEDNLNSECLYQLAQDAMEVCSKKADFSEDCFNILNEASGAHYSLHKNGHRLFGEEGKADVTITRDYMDKIELRVWA
jgi:hypothetical protein